MTRGLLLLLALSACRRAASPISEEPHQLIDDFSMSQSYRGDPDWRLEAKTAILKEDAKQAVLEDPRMEFYKKRKAVSRVSAMTGLVQTETHDVRLSRAVVVDSLEDASTLKTEEMTYSSARKKFLTDKAVVVNRPDGVLRGRGLEASPDFSEIRIFNQESVIRGTPR